MPKVLNDKPLFQSLTVIGSTIFFAGEDVLHTLCSPEAAVLTEAFCLKAAGWIESIGGILAAIGLRRAIK